MGIPRLRGIGTLPRGVHGATLSEVKKSFGRGTARRVQLMMALEEVLQHARKAGEPRVLIDGSFATSKDEPRDVDMVILVSEAFQEKLAEGQKSARWLKRKVQEKQPKLVDLFVAIDEEEWKSWVRFFQQDVWVGRKGVLEVSS